jgi:hypothetical protein
MAGGNVTDVISSCIKVPELVFLFRGANWDSSRILPQNAEEVESAEMISMLKDEYMLANWDS